MHIKMCIKSLRDLACLQRIICMYILNSSTSNASNMQHFISDGISPGSWAISFSNISAYPYGRNRGAACSAYPESVASSSYLVWTPGIDRLALLLFPIWLQSVEIDSSSLVSLAMTLVPRLSFPTCFGASSSLLSTSSSLIFFSISRTRGEL